MATKIGAVQIAGWNYWVSYIEVQRTGFIQFTGNTVRTGFVTIIEGRFDVTGNNSYFKTTELTNDTRLRNPTTLGYGGQAFAGHIFSSAVIVPYKGTTRL